MADPLIYFAYGSNMSSRRLQKRTPSARFIHNAYLSGHIITFDMPGLDGSGKCGIRTTQNTADRVHGVVFEIALDERPALDRAEGRGVAYDDIWVDVVTADNQTIKALTYYPLLQADDLLPWDWYKNHVTKGAREFSLPDDYCALLESQPDKRDLNGARKYLETCMYRQ